MRIPRDAIPPPVPDVRSEEIMPAGCPPDQTSTSSLADGEFLIDCAGRSTREINRAVRGAISSGTHRIRLVDPAARHNLGVALLEGVELTIDGSAGYYVGGLNDGATILVRGGVGWGAAESMRDGIVVIEGNAGNAVAASIRAGTVVVRGDASTRAGIAMKGGLLVVGGTVGPMAGFMMQKGIMIVCGDAADGVADSMYAGTVFLGGRHGELGADAVFEDMTPSDRELVGAALETWRVDPGPAEFRKLVAGKRLWNFERSDRQLWKSAL
jgi:glutamate synthase domain-containing protein 3